VGTALGEHEVGVVEVPADYKRTAAILDRLLHHCDVVSINGPSYRLKDHLAVTKGGGPLE
jgi:DNA replication protein DnaC